MVYTPQLSYHSSEMIRRLSWAFGLPMTKTLETIIKSFPLLVESSLVCSKCKNKTLCSSCVFSSTYEIKGTTEIMLDKISA
ncbi:hypothetical protein FACS1894190_06770 [Spirochaetia bacterium]|nr:hypothetical protein FACS1894190_06770 [Spirochaetia bacterium]